MSYPVINLHGTWTLKSDGGNISCPAEVPGDNYSALLAAGIISDPYYRLNELDALWVADTDWSYERTFDVPAEMLSANAVIINFDSIDTIAAVYINDKFIANVDNQFKRWRFQVKEYIKAGVNTLRLDFRSPVEASEEARKNYKSADLPSCGPYSSIKAINYIRKSQCSSGWDWGVSAPTSGMTGNVYIAAMDTAILEHVYDSQEFCGNTCKITFTAELAPVESAAIGSKVCVDFTFNGETKTAEAASPRCGGIKVSTEFKRLLIYLKKL